MDRISIITPCLNSLPLLKETVLSVIQQKALINQEVELEYIIRDGGSNDGTAQWIRELNHPAVQFFSEKDEGLYDALAKGLTHVTGDVVGYLNSGDYYGPYTFNILGDVFSDPENKWITGYSTCYNDKGYLISANLPLRYRRRFILKGLYGIRLPWIQQESTFWRAELLSQIDMKALTEFRLAGDYYLWARFARAANLNIVKAYLGGFREHSGQLSEDKAQYYEEIQKIIGEKINFFDYCQVALDYVMWWYLPDRLKLFINPHIIQL